MLLVSGKLHPLMHTQKVQVSFMIKSNSALVSFFQYTASAQCLVALIRSKMSKLIMLQ